ncbi:hypothetical protein B484DRAFT_395562 [Ochromonadaceae sp. CCMP2298]|nr:hypothetical protein B484DRAFT_395562 [Ochromonadaceae sp. CCMP2298]
MAVPSRKDACLLVLDDLLFTAGDKAGTYLSRFMQRLKPILCRVYRTPSKADSRHFEGRFQEAVTRLPPPKHPMLLCSTVNTGFVGYYSEVTSVFLAYSAKINRETQTVYINDLEIRYRDKSAFLISQGNRNLHDRSRYASNPSPLQATTTRGLQGGFFGSSSGSSSSRIAPESVEERKAYETEVRKAKSGLVYVLDQEEDDFLGLEDLDDEQDEEGDNEDEQD